MRARQIWGALRSTRATSFGLPRTASKNASPGFVSGRRAASSGSRKRNEGLRPVLLPPAHLDKEDRNEHDQDPKRRMEANRPHFQVVRGTPITGMRIQLAAREPRQITERHH